MNDPITQGFHQGVHDALAMGDTALLLIGALSLVVIAIVGMYTLRGIYRWFTR